MIQAVRDPIQERSKLTRSKIIEASASLLELQGYAATRLDEIADDIEMSRGALYHHFPSKAVLAEAVVKAHYDRWQVVMDRVRSSDLPPLSRIITLTYEVARISQIDPVVRAGLRLQLEHALVEKDLPNKLTIPYIGWIAHLTDIVADGQTADEITKAISADDIATNLVESYFGIQHVSFRLSNGMDLPDRLRRWWRILLPAIATPDWLMSNQQILDAPEAK